MSKSLSEALNLKEEQIKKSPSLAEVFVNAKTKTVFKQGDLIKRIKYANTLRNISENGYETFYRGDLASTVVREINKNGI